MNDFEALVRSRRSVRHFRADPLPDGLLERLLGIAQWAPSGYNLQPTHFVAVTDQGPRRAALCRACLGQKPILQAPASVVFCGDRHVFRNHHERVLAMDRGVGATSPEYEALIRKYVPLAFKKGPLGMGGRLKALLPALLSRFMPIPAFPAAQIDSWLTRQVMLTAMTFMLAAWSEGVASLPMEGFDERRVREALSIPRSMHVAVVIPVGYAADAALTKSRLPLKDVLHLNQW